MLQLNSSEYPLLSKYHDHLDQEIQRQLIEIGGQEKKQEFSIVNQDGFAGNYTREIIQCRLSYDLIPL